MTMRFIKVMKKGRKAVVTFDRPEALNALNEEVLDELDKVIDDLEADSEVKAIILTGAGKAFIAGADLLAMENLQGESARKFMVKGTRVFRRLELLEKPVIAALNGYTFGGGCELALCADFRIASEKALIGMPETGLGIIPGFNGTQRLPRLIGVSRAKEWIYLGRNHSAQEAYEAGLVCRVTS